jgi:hypothetical protein
MTCDSTPLRPGVTGGALEQLGGCQEAKPQGPGSLHLLPWSLPADRRRPSRDVSHEPAACGSLIQRNFLVVAQMTSPPAWSVSAMDMTRSSGLHPPAHADTAQPNRVTGRFNLQSLNRTELAAARAERSGLAFKESEP